MNPQTHPDAWADAGLTVRPITPADDAALAALVRRSLKAVGLDIPGTAYADPGLDRLSAQYGQPGRVYLALCRGGETVGGAGLAPFWGFPDCCELQKLYLAEELRGRGLGETLLRRVEDEARSMGFRRIYLETHRRLKAALRLYARLGYREISRPACVVHGAMDRFFLKDLPDDAGEK